MTFYLLAAKKEETGFLGSSGIMALTSIADDIRIDVAPKD